MSISLIIDSIHQKLARSSLAVRLAILTRNQCRRVIRYHLNEDANPFKNGEAWLVKNLAKDSSVFIDVGANVGTWTDFFLKSMSNEGKGILFEPSEQAIYKLRQHFAQKSSIELVNAAVSDISGEMSFFEEPNSGETSSLVEGFSNSTASKKLVKVVTLDDEVEKRSLEHIDFLKIDTEGYDLHVLRGTSRLLENNKIDVIQFEYNSPWAFAGSTLAEAFRLLKSFGYKVFLLKSTGLFEFNYASYGEYFEYSNFIAISPNKYSKIQHLVKGVL